MSCSSDVGFKSHGKGRFGRLSLKGIGGRTVVTRSEEYSSDGKSINYKRSSRKKGKHAHAYTLRNGSLCKQSSLDPESCSPESATSGGGERGTNQRRTLYFAGDNQKCGFAGILWPKLSNEFHDKQLEAGYQKYSHRQRQKSLIIVNLINIIFKLVLFKVYHFNLYSIKMITCSLGIAFNLMIIFFISSWKHCANNYLHIAAIVTWIMFNIEGMVIYIDCD